MNHEQKLIMTALAKGHKAVLTGARWRWATAFAGKPSLAEVYVGELFERDYVRRNTDDTPNTMRLTVLGKYQVAPDGKVAKAVVVKRDRDNRCAECGADKRSLHMVSCSHSEESKINAKAKRTPVVLPHGSSARVDVPATAAFVRSQRTIRLKLLLDIVKVLMAQIKSELDAGLKDDVEFQLRIMNDALESIESVL